MASAVKQVGLTVGFSSTHALPLPESVRRETPLPLPEVDSPPTSRHSHGPAADSCPARRPRCSAHSPAWLTATIDSSAWQPAVYALAAASGYDTSVDDVYRKVYYDLTYIRGWNLVKDLKILFATILVVSNGRGAC